MMHGEVKQLIPAPGWRVWIADYIDCRAQEVPVLGWGVVKYTNDDADVEDLNLCKTFTSVDLVVYYIESGVSVRLLHDQAAILVLPPYQEITDDDKAEIEDDAKSGKRRNAEQNQAVMDRHNHGLSAPQIARELNIPRDEVQSTIYCASLRRKRQALAVGR